MKNIILRTILILLILAVIGLFVYDCTVNNEFSSKNFVRVGCIITLSIVAFIRTFQVRRRRSLQFYDSTYSEFLEHAFQEQPFWRKKLLCAVRLYNENKFEKALKYLSDLKQKTQTNADIYAVDLFAALCFTDMQMYGNAIQIYQHLVSTGKADSTIYSNLGHVQLKNREYKNAIENYRIALQYDQNNAFAYNNIAQAHFQMYEFNEAIAVAEQALEVDPQMYQASSLLAVIYALLADKENSEKYFHIAISNGQRPQALKESIEYFRNAQLNTVVEEINEEQ